MAFDPRNHAPKEAFNTKGEFSYSLLLEHMENCYSLAERAVEASSCSLVERKVLTLVDLQGVYLSLTEWLKAKKVPLENGTIVSRIALFLFESAIYSIKSDILQDDGGKGILFDDLVEAVRKKQRGPIESVNQVVKVTPQIELFYAPVPLGEIEGWLAKFAESGSLDAQRHLGDISRGVLNYKWGSRDYSVYEDFVQKLKDNPVITQSQEGYFNFFVKPGGISSFDEKEVDIRIAIRSMDACSEYEADSLCIVSSDQDFVPLHSRCREFGTRTYQADVANFASHRKIGRKLRELDVGFIEARVDPSWPLRVIVEACEPALYDISMNEFEALCSLHNELNEVKISPHKTADGAMSIKMYRPL